MFPYYLFSSYRKCSPGSGSVRLLLFGVLRLRGGGLTPPVFHHQPTLVLCNIDERQVRAGFRLQRLKAPLLDPRLLCGECFSSGAHGTTGPPPKKEIKDRNMFGNKYKAETQLEKWRISPSQSYLEGEAPQMEWKTSNFPALDLYMYILDTHTHTDTESTSAAHTRPAHAALHHCAPRYNKPCLKCINLLTTMVMCTLRGIPPLLTSCSWNIVCILTVNWTRIKHTAREHESLRQICWYLIVNEHRRQEEKSKPEKWMKVGSVNPPESRCSRGSGNMEGKQTLHLENVWTVILGI